VWAASLVWHAGGEGDIEIIGLLFYGEEAGQSSSVAAASPTASTWSRGASWPSSSTKPPNSPSASFS